MSSQEAVETAREIPSFLKLQVDMMGEVHEKNESPVSKWKYNSIMVFVLREGFDFELGELPEGVERGKIKECFCNAYRVAEKHGLVYVEGYAAGIIPVHHAWCVGKDNKVIEVTWPEPGHEYLGVPFNLHYVADTMVATGHYGILDTYTIKFPLLQGDEGWQLGAEDG